MVPHFCSAKEIKLAQKQFQNLNKLFCVMKFSSWCFILVVGSQIQEHVSCRTIIFFFNRVIFILTKRQEMDNTLGSSKAVSVANKQLTRTCVVVTCVFIVTLGKSFYSHYRLIDFFFFL